MAGEASSPGAELLSNDKLVAGKDAGSRGVMTLPAMVAPRGCVFGAGLL